MQTMAHAVLHEQLNLLAAAPMSIAVSGTSVARRAQVGVFLAVVGTLSACGSTDAVPGRSRATLRDASGGGIIISNGLRTDWLTGNALSKDPAANAALT